MNWVRESLGGQNAALSEAECELVSHHAWAQTFRVTASDTRYWLKILPEETKVSLEALSLISKTFPDHVPRLIRFDSAARSMLYADHGGSEPGHSMSHEQSMALLRTYAHIQGTSHRQPELIAHLPSENPTQYLEQFMHLLETAGEKSSPEAAARREHPGNPFSYYRRDVLAFLREFFEASQPMLRAFIERSERLPRTLNHGDLRGANAAFLDDGRVRLFDWDEAVVGPVGLSLHAQFGGCFGVCLALQTDAEAGTEEDQHFAELLAAYVDTLVSDHGFDREQLRKGLPASVCAGVIRYICSFSPYPIEDEDTRKAISRNVWTRLEDLMNLVQLLSIEAGEEKVLEMAYVLHSHQHSERAYDLYTKAGLKPKLPGTIMRSIEEAAPPEVFPAIRIPAEEREAGTLAHLTVNTAVELFKKYGAVMIQDAISRELVEAAYREFLERKEAHEQSIMQDRALEVGDQRFMITIDLSGPFANPGLFASPLVLPILKKLLSDELILGSFTSVASMPGAPDQPMHRDTPALFYERPHLLHPPFSVNLIIPLVRLNEETGATRIIKGSHRPGYDPDCFQDPEVDLGSCYLLDARVQHFGRANRSPRARPILSLVFQRPWYRDPVNFHKQPSLSVTPEAAAKVPENVRSLVSWSCS